MKLKGKAYGYLGHFRREKYLRMGHNNSDSADQLDKEMDRMSYERTIDDEVSSDDFEHILARDADTGNRGEGLSGQERRILQDDRDENKAFLKRLMAAGALGKKQK